jgi:hypothetical protein
MIGVSPTRPGRLYGVPPVEVQAARVGGELHDEPRERDVLHPRSGNRRELPGEEEAVVSVPAQ